MIADLSVEQFEKELSCEGVLLLDVRTPLEYSEKHIRGSLLIPLDEIPARIDELESYRNRPVLIYCKAGVRSFYAGMFLRESGFTTVSHLQAGILGWIHAGKDVEK